MSVTSSCRDFFTPSGHPAALQPVPPLQPEPEPEPEPEPGGGKGGLATAEAPGRNEVYLTQPDGSLSRVYNHGLDRKPWTRARYVYPLKAYDGEQLVLITAELGPHCLLAPGSLMMA